jgi:hypothetical protein
MVAGLAAMRLLDRAAFQRLDELGAAVRAGLDDCFKQGSVSGLPPQFILGRNRRGAKLPE